MYKRLVSHAGVQRGFTLIELLIVIAIIGILATVIMPAANSARDKAMVAAAIAELDGVNKAIELLYNDTGYYPNGEATHCRSTIPSNNEVDLTTANAGLLANGLSLSGWNGPYIPVATDKWGNPFFLDEDYQCLSATEGCRGVNDAGEDSSVLVSCGPNGVTADGACAYDADNVVIRLCD